MAIKNNVKNDITVEEKALTVAESNPNALAVLGDDLAMDAMTGSGFESVKPEDTAIPFIKILQTNSPECKKATRVGDAEEGDFFNTVSQEIFRGTMYVIPCAFQKVYVEWIPRGTSGGGGFVGVHYDAKIMEGTTKDEKKKDVLPNGNHIIPTAQHFCLIVREDKSFAKAVISFTSTQLKKSRKWLSQMMALQVSIGGKRITPPMFSHIYPFSTVEETNDQGSWYGYSIGAPVMISDKNLYAEAKKFYTEVAAGNVKVSEPPIPESANNDISDVEDKM